MSGAEYRENCVHTNSFGAQGRVQFSVALPQPEREASWTVKENSDLEYSIISVSSHLTRILSRKPASLTGAPKKNKLAPHYDHYQRALSSLLVQATGWTRQVLRE